MAPALSAPANAKSCFCMAHIASSEVKYYGCTEFKPENAATPEVMCHKLDSVVTEAVDSKSYKPIAEGVGQCNPCNPPPPRKGDCPRGESCPAPAESKP
jgi:hypothetical protein